jgi:hypothetical protein
MLWLNAASTDLFGMSIKDWPPPSNSTNVLSYYRIYKGRNIESGLGDGMPSHLGGTLVKLA